MLRNNLKIDITLHSKNRSSKGYKRQRFPAFCSFDLSISKHQPAYNYKLSKAYRLWLIAWWIFFAKDGL